MGFVVNCWACSVRRWSIIDTDVAWRPVESFPLNYKRNVLDGIPSQSGPQRDFMGRRVIPSLSLLLAAPSRTSHCLSYKPHYSPFIMSMNNISFKSLHQRRNMHGTNQESAANNQIKQNEHSNGHHRDHDHNSIFHTHSHDHSHSHGAERIVQAWKSGGMAISIPPPLWFLFMLKTIRRPRQSHHAYWPV